MDVSTQAIPRFTPQQYLNSQETVLFDTRPHFMAVVGLGGIAWFLILSIVVPGVADGIAQAVKESIFWWVLLAWLGVVLLPLVFRILFWHSMFYSLTDQRIMHGYGVISRALDAQQLKRIGGMLDVTTYRITGVTFAQGWSGRLFNFGNIVFETNNGNIRWFGIKKPLNVRRLIEEKVSAFQETGANQQTYNEAVIRKVAEIRTEESFGLIEPKKHPAGLQGKPGEAGLLQAPAAAPAATRYCPNCGGPDNGESAFCRQCGKPLR